MAPPKRTRRCSIRSSREQSGGFSAVATKLDAANYTIEHGDALFCFFDAYDKASLDWLEAVLAKRTARHCFVIIHPPVVPYGARATWNLYSAERDKAQREKAAHHARQAKCLRSRRPHS